MGGKRDLIFYVIYLWRPPHPETAPLAPAGLGDPVSHRPPHFLPALYKYIASVPMLYRSCFVFYDSLRTILTRSAAGPHTLSPLPLRRPVLTESHSFPQEPASCGLDRTGTMLRFHIRRLCCVVCRLESCFDPPASLILQN